MKKTRSFDVKGIMKIKVKSISDIARVAASAITMGQPTYLIRFSMQGKTIIGMLAVFRDFYDLYGVPLFYYYSCEKDNEECKRSNYISFKLDESGENISLVNSNIPGTVLIPIINIEEIPEFLRKKR